MRRKFRDTIPALRQSAAPLQGSRQPPLRTSPGRRGTHRPSAQQERRDSCSAPARSHRTLPRPAAGPAFGPVAEPPGPAADKARHPRDLAIGPNVENRELERAGPPQHHSRSEAETAPGIEGRAPGRSGRDDPPGCRVSDDPPHRPWSTHRFAPNCAGRAAHARSAKSRAVRSVRIASETRCDLILTSYVGAGAPAGDSAPPMPALPPQIISPPVRRIWPLLRTPPGFASTDECRPTLTPHLPAVLNPRGSQGRGPRAGSHRRRQVGATSSGLNRNPHPSASMMAFHGSIAGELRTRLRPMPRRSRCHRRRIAVSLRPSLRAKSRMRSTRVRPHALWIGASSAKR